MGIFTPSATDKKLGYFFSNPGKAIKVVAKATSQALSGKVVTRNTITAKQQAASQFTIGDVLTLPLVGPVSGATGGVAAIASSLLGEKSKASNVIANNPLAVAAGLTAAVVAPGALLYGASTLIPDKPTAPSWPSSPALPVAPATPSMTPAPAVSTAPKRASPTRRKVKKRKPASRKRGSTRKRSRNSSKQRPSKRRRARKTRRRA